MLDWRPGILDRTRRGFRPPGLGADPGHGVGFEGIDRLDPGFGVSTAWALIEAVLETFRSSSDGSGYHPRVAVGAARTVDRQQLWIGFSCPCHRPKVAPI